MIGSAYYYILKKFYTSYNTRVKLQLYISFLLQGIMCKLLMSTLILYLICMQATGPYHTGLKNCEELVELNTFRGVRCLE